MVALNTSGMPSLMVLGAFTLATIEEYSASTNAVASFESSGRWSISPWMLSVYICPARIEYGGTYSVLECSVRGSISKSSVLSTGSSDQVKSISG